MRLTPRLHDVYVGQVVLVTVLLTWAVLVGLDVVMALSGEVSDLGQGNYTFGHAVAWVLYTVPRRAYTMFPTAAVIGSLMGLGQLAASSELTALRALGLSRRRLSISVAAALAILTGLMVFSGETLGPWGQRQADVLKMSARTGNVAMDRYSGLWAREGNTFLYAQSGEEKDQGGGKVALQLRDVRMYELAEDGRLASIAHAATAEHLDGYWLLKNVRRTTFNERSATQTTVLGERWESELDAAVLSSSLVRARNMPSHELSQNIDYRKRNGLDARDYEDQYWGRWFYPLNVLALCLAAIPFAFGSLRSGGMGKRLFLGIVFAVGFWALQTMFVRLAGAFRLDYRIAYAVPPLALLAISWAMFGRRSR
ncbi:LPS export ABC transporter permease LptG [Pseudoxanthomonas sp. Root630]|uniref:LPS export ABC transporter permease LptG n=1 Tax=Pseudoxanthomonas sp. Root630 TaxID=1736574 RepID=UPI000702CC5D|nr:LPS export ABC transporter permease LptG [Pseudoxanthomonas sp. Root630]KRA46665.1 LPS export ABC transporter permease LptG [Pseudoxanthomonas sp. Root630]